MMAFKRNDIQRISNALNCRPEAVKSAIYAGNAYLKENQTNTYTTARCVSIIIDKLQRAPKEDIVEFPDFNMKHIGIRKYRAKIIELHESTTGTSKGWGWIALEIKRLYKIKISRQTIRSYILKYEEIKACQI